MNITFSMYFCVNDITSSYQWKSLEKKNATGTLSINADFTIHLPISLLRYIFQSIEFTYHSIEIYVYVSVIVLFICVSICA